MPTITENGVELYYEEYGAGDALVLIQGLTYATPMWHWQIPELQKYFRVIAFDNRGSGRSGKPDTPYSIRMFADDTVALMDTLGIKHAHVLGISMGGLIAQEVALSFPERVDRLVLCATLFGGATASPLDPGTLSYLMNYQEKVSDEVVRLEIAYGSGSGFTERHPDRVTRMVQFKQQTRPPRFAYFRQLASGTGYVSEDRLRKMKIPTLILAGKQDRIIPVENSSKLHALIPGSQLKIFEDAGHHPHMEIPDEFNQAVIEFLKYPSQNN